MISTTAKRKREYEFKSQALPQRVKEQLFEVNLTCPNMHTPVCSARVELVPTPTQPLGGGGSSFI